MLQRGLPEQRKITLDMLLHSSNLFEALFNFWLNAEMYLTRWEAGEGGVQVFVDAVAGIQSTKGVCVYFTHSLAITTAGRR